MVADDPPELVEQNRRTAERALSESLRLLKTAM